MHLHIFFCFVEDIFVTVCDGDNVTLAVIYTRNEPTISYFVSKKSFLKMTKEKCVKPTENTISIVSECPLQIYRNNEKNGKYTKQLLMNESKNEVQTIDSVGFFSFDDCFSYQFNGKQKIS